MAWLLRHFVLLPALAAAAAFADTTGINLLKPAVAARIDAEVRTHDFTWVKTSLVHGGRVVYEKAYGNNRLDQAHIWASISKPVTAMITMQLIAKGIIKSLDDNIWVYAGKYSSHMPAQYAGSDLTIRHIMTHTSGIPHYDKPTFVNGKFNLQSKPGARYSYSTHAWGVLGEVLTSATGKDFNTLVKEYIGAPAGAPSFRAENQDRVWRSPAGFVFSTSKDMGLFAAAVMKHTYVSESMLYDTIAKSYFSSGQGLGWRFSGSGNNLVLSHSGSASDGSNQSTFLRVLPRAQISAGALGLGGGFSTLCARLTAILANETEPVAVLPPMAEAASSAGLPEVAVVREGSAIRFTLRTPGEGVRSLAVHRPDGSLVWKQDWTSQPMGTHIVRWQGPGAQAAGAYWVSLETRKHRISRKFMYW